MNREPYGIPAKHDAGRALSNGVRVPLLYSATLGSADREEESVLSRAERPHCGSRCLRRNPNRAQHAIAVVLCLVLVRISCGQSADSGAAGAEPVSPLPDVVFIPTPHDVVPRMLELASVGKSELSGMPPYDITHLRWNVHGDNGSPDAKVAEVVRNWNARYAWPRLIISTTTEAFRAFERRYGDKLPEYSGDYTPYWEDGAASSARETAMNRASAERLLQAETLWAMHKPGPFPAAAFQEAWRNVLLYSEHTWGADVYLK